MVFLLKFHDAIACLRGNRELLSGNLSMHCAHPWQRHQEKAMWGKGEVGKCPNAGDKCLIAGVAVLQCGFFCRG